MTFRQLICEALPESARTSRNRFFTPLERGLLIACEDRKAHGEFHRRPQ